MSPTADFSRVAFAAKGTGNPRGARASGSALRRTLLAESLLLCVAGALFGCSECGAYGVDPGTLCSRFSVRAQDLTVDSSMLWVGAVLAIIASVLLA